MLEKLKAIEERLTEVERQLSDPAVYADRERLTALSREQKELTPVVACYRAYAQAVQTAEDAAAMLSDPELRELAQEELTAAKADMERLTEELKRLLLPRGEGPGGSPGLGAGCEGADQGLPPDHLPGCRALGADG